MVRFAHIATKPKNCCGQLNKALCAVETLCFFCFVLKAQWQYKLCWVRCCWKGKQGVARASPGYDKTVGLRSLVQISGKMVGSFKAPCHSGSESLPAKRSYLYLRAGLAFNRLCGLPKTRTLFQRQVERVQPETQRY